jgi:hypothetical protein
MVQVPRHEPNQTPSAHSSPSPYAPTCPGDRDAQAGPGTLPGGLDTALPREPNDQSPASVRRPWHPSQGGAPPGGYMEKALRW